MCATYRWARGIAPWTVGSLCPPSSRALRSWSLVAPTSWRVSKNAAQKMASRMVTSRRLHHPALAAPRVPSHLPWLHQRLKLRAVCTRRLVERLLACTRAIAVHTRTSPHGCGDLFVVAFNLRETSAVLVLDEGDAPRDARPYRVLKRHRLTNAETIFTSPDFRAGVWSL